TNKDRYFTSDSRLEKIALDFFRIVSGLVASKACFFTRSSIDWWKFNLLFYPIFREIYLMTSGISRGAYVL
ncbi:hypothetical protein, partial [Streptococcus suis]|uniref:hypothetical protein n=1 Tax=Streptococcus suis TaxID=1307 RepID=UPI001EDD3A4C